VINLRKIQEACCYEPTSKKKNQTGAEDFDEEQFTYEFTRCVLRVMPVKKSESVGERVIRFIGLFLRHANEKDNELIPEADQDAGVMVETPSTRLTSHLMSAILPLLTAKEKFVRYRSTQLISHVINSLEAIDDDLFQLLRHGLLKRIHDKEAMVRVQAVLGLGRLAGNEADGEADDSDDDDSGAGLLEKLLDVQFCPIRYLICWNELGTRTRQLEEHFIHGFCLLWETSDICLCPCVRNFSDGVSETETKMSERLLESFSESVGSRIVLELPKQKKAKKVKQPLERSSPLASMVCLSSWSVSTL
jgi:hypothetical protein